MGFKSEVDAILAERDIVAFRPGAAYAQAVAGGVHTIFTITGGAIWAKLLIGRVTAAPTGAPQLLATCNGQQACVGAVAVNGAVGTLICVPLNVLSVVLNPAAYPRTTTAVSDNSMIIGTGAVGAAAIITITISVGATVLNAEWALVYKPLSPTVVVT